MSGTPATLPAARLAVLDRVRCGDATVNALASSLDVSDNAVRVHLAALERDGFLRKKGVARSGQAGQPAAEYELTGAGEIALSSAYPPALTALVAALSAKLDARTARAVLVDAGRRLSSDTPSHASGSFAERVKSCATLLTSLGGSVSVEQGRSQATITGAGCPLASAVRGEPLTCTLIEALLERHADLRVTQRCDHGDRPACRFQLEVEK